MGRGNLPWFRGNGERVIHIYGEEMAEIYIFIAEL